MTRWIARLAGARPSARAGRRAVDRAPSRVDHRAVFARFADALVLRSRFGGRPRVREV
ncbi:MAG: hypothetical protein LWW93_01890 [Hyphomicrobiales bacterium]|nr:hypothetical protein [Hyphomicrobiales bacterium]